MESFEERLQRFLLGRPSEVFSTILNSICNFTVPELRAATERGLHYLALLGAHSVMQTIGEQIYGKTGVEATTFYLTNFVDGGRDDTKFSAIAQELHKYRNIYAHRWSSRFSHVMAMDTSEDRGWWRDEEGLHLNPVVFMRCFSAGFRAHGPMWTMPRRLDELRALQRKYAYLCQWLEVGKETRVWKEILALQECKDLGVAQKQEAVVRESILLHFGLLTSQPALPGSKPTNASPEGA